MERRNDTPDPAAPEGHGHYMGTEIGAKWWRRYRGRDYFARGKGRWRIEDGQLVFKRLMLSGPVRIPLADVTGVRLGTWHSGQWAGGKPVIKILWRRQGLELCSGFVLAATRARALELAALLAAEAERPASHY